MYYGEGVEGLKKFCKKEQLSIHDYFISFGNERMKEHTSGWKMHEKKLNITSY